MLIEARKSLLGAVLACVDGGRYHLRELLGEGGQGVIYKAQRDGEDEWVVVKLLRPEGLEESTRARFEREAAVLRMLGAGSTPNAHVVRFHDYGVYPMRTAEGAELSVPFIVLEHVDGQTLTRVIQAHGGFGLPVVRVRRIMGHVARGLMAVHEHRIVHRDLKPANILLTQQEGQEIAKVTDFGLVKAPYMGTHRTTGVAGASLGYAPPEQYEMGNHRVSVQTDVFSFAAILYEALSGSEAYPCGPGDNPLRILARMQSGERPALGRVRATIPAELRDKPELTVMLDREIGRAMSAEPTMRHGSMREFWQNVEPLLREALGPRAASTTDDLVLQDPRRSRSVMPSALPSVQPLQWHVIGKALQGDVLRSVVGAGEDGLALVGLGSRGLHHFSRGVWAAMQLPKGVDPRFIRGLTRLPSGELLFFGEAGFAMTLAPSGASDLLAIEDRDITLLGAFAGPQGLVLLGERLSRAVGVMVEMSWGGPAVVQTIEGTVRLQAAAQLRSGNLLIAGTHGALFEWTSEGARDIAWGRTGHLYAVAASADGGAYAVGSGGHALSIAFPEGENGPIATLESVQTTRDLTTLAVDTQGQVHAGGGQARMVQRCQGAWMRLPLDPAVQGHIVFIGPHSAGLLVATEDGVVVDGRPPV